MKIVSLLFLIVILISCVHGSTFWQELRKYFVNGFALGGFSWESQFLIRQQNLPAKPDPQFPALKLYVFTRRYNSIVFAIVDKIDPANLDKYASEFNFNAYPTVLYAYGFLDKPVKFDGAGFYQMTTSTLVFWSYIYRILAAEFIKSKGVTPPKTMYTNLVIVDWSEYNTDYLKSLSSLPSIANVIADKLYAMSQNSSNPLDLSTWHFIGHSLGAHLVGQVARIMRKKSGRVVIPRVTGLDPAGPIIEFELIRWLYPRLTKDVAQFVDIIHTNAGVYGSDRVLGHAGTFKNYSNWSFLFYSTSANNLREDFWPNSGKWQPGCPRTTFTDIITRPEALCSHLRAVEFYAESVVSDSEELIFNSLGIPSPVATFEAVRCERCAEFNFLFDKIKLGKLQCAKVQNVRARMGIRASSALPEGNYYLTTNSECREIYGYSLAENGTRSYLEGNAAAEELSFQ